jgi:hypothetical protein
VRPDGPATSRSESWRASASSSTKNGEPRGRRGAEQRSELFRHLGGGERLERHLVEQAVAPQVVAEAAQRMRARKVVRAIRADDEQLMVADRPRDQREQLQRCLVGPVKVVEQDRRRGVAGHRAEAAADRLDDRRAIADRIGRAELGEQHGELGPHRGRAAVEAAGHGAQVAAHSRGERAVRRPGRRSGPAHEAEAALTEDLLGEACLSDPSLAAEQDDGATSRARGASRDLEAGTLG